MGSEPKFTRILKIKIQRELEPNFHGFRHVTLCSWSCSSPSLDDFFHHGTFEQRTPKSSTCGTLQRLLQGQLLALALYNYIGTASFRVELSSPITMVVNSQEVCGIQWGQYYSAQLIMNRDYVLNHAKRSKINASLQEVSDFAAGVYLPGLSLA